MLIIEQKSKCVGVCLLGAAGATVYLEWDFVNVYDTSQKCLKSVYVCEVVRLCGGRSPGFPRDGWSWL